jgi:hypothetical protein
VNILVSLDTKKSRIVYSEVIQLFEIIQYQATEENDTDVVVPLPAKIITEMIVLFHNNQEKQDNRKQLYINWE